MLKDRRHILLKDNQYSNTLVEPIEITSLESLGISITKDETVGLFPGFIVRDYSIDTEHKRIRIFLKSIESERHSCPLCSGKKVHVHAYRDVWYKDSPIGDYKVEICITVTRYICYSCRYGFSDRPKIVHPYYRLTKRAYSYILNMLQSEDATVSKVSKLTGISWQTVKDIEKAALRKRFADVDTSQVRYIAMDEISIKKRHTYATLIIDAQTQVLLAAIEGRTQADIAPFFEMLQERGHAQNIKGATMDANAGFNTIVKQYCPNAVIVLDQFHVIQNYNNQVIDAERINLQEDISKRAEELNLSVNKTPKQISMGLKWAVFTGYERLLKNNEIDHELKELVLNKRNLNANNFEFLIQALTTNNCLTTLDVSNNPIGHGTEAIKKYPLVNLEKLIMNNCSIYSDDFSLLCQGIEKDKQLKHVELNNNNIDNSAIAVKAIERLFKENKVLQVFSLKFNSIGKVDIEQYVDDKSFQRIMTDEVNQIFS